MQALEEQGAVIDLGRSAGSAGLADGATPASQAAEHAVLTETFVLDVLAAVAEMALRSKRRQADLDAALHRAGLQATGACRRAVLERLVAQGAVDKVVELLDGGVLLSVTARGLDCLGAARVC